MKHRVRRSESEWKTIIREQAASGLGVGKFCKNESISVSSFYRWRQRLSSMPMQTANRDVVPAFIDMGRADDFGAASCDAVLESSPSALELTLDLGPGIKLTLRRN